MVSKRIKMLGKKPVCVLLVLAILFVCVSFVALHSEVGDSYFGKTQEACSENGCPEEKNPPDNTLPGEINIIITFTNAIDNANLQKKFTVTVGSLLKHTSVPLAIHILGDPESEKLAKNIIADNAVGKPYRLVRLDIDHLASQLADIVRPMQDHFSYKPGAYYNHALFFMSIAMHKVMPETMTKVIMLDADLRFREDIQKLYERFETFTADNIMGIAREAQPVYYHTFWKYRNDHPGTRVGAPPPNGLTGFNSGVLLLNLDHMRKSVLYNSLLNRDSLHELTEEFHFKGHLGDQDFFTLLNMKYESLFHVLPCNWNRQLCTWWNEHGYKDIFDSYFHCDGDVYIYHGNCNTPIPEDL